jgi:segregation and condensation protein B
VNSDYSIQKLLEKELIVITGRNEQMPGKPLVYSTSRHFMDYFGINSAEDLPRINEVLADQIVAPTLVNADHFDVEEGAVLAVSEDGELIAKAIEEGAEDEIIEIEMVDEVVEENDSSEANDEMADDSEDQPLVGNNEAADDSADGSGDKSEDDSEESTSGEEDDERPR